jgi:decaprenyl-phosphate phosphoribosyltransferase
VTSYIKLLRPHQWVKNLFVFIPAFFAARISLVYETPRILVAFLSFCAAASAVYVFNDLRDLENDRAHEVKRNRPLATGSVDVKWSIILMMILAAVALVGSLYVGTQLLYVIGGYIFLNVLYSLFLKHISLIDISVIAVGFVLRVIAGGIAAEVPVSKWLILMTFLLACCLALGKRRDDLLLDADNDALRPALRGYTLQFIDTCLIVLSVTTIVSYIMYTVSEDVVRRLHSDHVYLTSGFVILGILRFLQIAIVEQKSGSPTMILLKDRMIQIMIGLWFTSFMVILYAT